MNTVTILENNQKKELFNSKNINKSLIFFINLCNKNINLNNKIIFKKSYFQNNIIDTLGDINGIFENNKIEFYYGNNKEKNIGGVMSFFSEINEIPSKIFSNIYENFLEKLLNNKNLNPKIQNKENNQNIIQEKNINNDNSENNNTSNKELDIEDIIDNNSKLLSKYKDLDINLSDKNKLSTFISESDDVKEKIKENNNDTKTKLDNEKKELMEINSELRYQKNKLNREKEKEEERTNIYLSNKLSFYKIKNDIKNPQKTYMTEDSIPILFQTKYHIFYFMDKNEIIINGEVNELEYKLFKCFENIIDTFNNSSNEELYIEEEFEEICEDFIDYIAEKDLEDEKKIIKELSNEKYNHIFDNEFTED